MHQLCGAGSGRSGAVAADCAFSVGVGVGLTIIYIMYYLYFISMLCMGLYLEVASGTIRVRGGRVYSQW